MGYSPSNRCRLSNQEELPSGNDDDNTLSVVKALTETETLLADFDKRYHTSGGNKLGYTNVALVGFGNRYTPVHHYFFLPPFWIPEPNCY